jgi:hypothetical protein
MRKIDESISIVLPVAKEALARGNVNLIRDELNMLLQVFGINLDPACADYPPAATSSTLSATTSQPQVLLSIARLNMARSRTRPSIWSFVRIDQTCFGRSGGFDPVSFPLFQGRCLIAITVVFSRSSMFLLLSKRRDKHGLSPCVEKDRLEAVFLVALGDSAMSVSGRAKRKTSARGGYFRF